MVYISEVLTDINSYVSSYIQNRINKIQMGSDGTTPSANDTAIGTLLETGNLTETDTTVANQVTYSARFGITSFVGSTVREVTTFNSTTNKITTRNLTVEAVKGADQVFWASVTVKWNTVNK